jgi:hypothetical protein
LLALSSSKSLARSSASRSASEEKKTNEGLKQERNV